MRAVNVGCENVDIDCVARACVYHVSLKEVPHNDIILWTVIVSRFMGRSLLMLFSPFFFGRDDAALEIAHFRRQITTRGTRTFVMKSKIRPVKMCVHISMECTPSYFAV